MIKLNVFQLPFGGFEVSPGSGAKGQQTATDDVCAARHKGNENSIAANPAFEQKVKQRRLITEALERVGEATCEKLEDLTFSKHQSVSARISELHRDGLIVKCGRGKTRSGSSCAIYKLA